jgi:glycosyltransferase involved in cell wall biosynthesis
MSNPPLISIAVCTYNGATYLKQQLQSLFSQTYKNIEIIVNDDNSDDSTPLILKEFEALYPNFRYQINERNLGYIKNFEKILHYCKGEFIAFCDQDDYWLPNKIEVMLKNFSADDVMMYHDSEFMDENGKLLNKKLSQTSGFIDRKHHHEVVYNNCVAGHAMMFRNVLIKEIVPFPKDIPHDHWVTYVALITGKVGYLSDVLVRYRQHALSITDILDNRKFNSKREELHRKLHNRTKINDARIANIRSINTFKKNTSLDIKLYVQLIELLNKRDEQCFSAPLFRLLFANRKPLFGYLHKNIISITFRIFQESVGNKAKVLWFNLIGKF